MRKILLLALQLLLVTSFIKAQCPTAGFTMPDTVCAGESFQALNISTGGTSFFWDLCPGDLEMAPQTSLLPPDANLNLPQQMKVVTENGNHYLFMVNYSGNNLLRYDFGNNINNTPVVYDYGNVGGLLFNPGGMDIALDNGEWYVFVANNSGFDFIRINLGASIANNTATAASAGAVGLFSPGHVKIVKDAGNYFVFVSNWNGGKLTKVEFGNSLANSPLAFSDLVDPSIGALSGFDVAYDCSINNWVGFYASNSLSEIKVIDFGSTLTNPGMITSSIPCISGPTGIEITRDGSNWYLMLNSLSTSEFQKIKIPENLLATPAALQSYVIPSASSVRDLAIFRDSSVYTVFIANNYISTLGKLTFTKPCFSEPNVSTDPVSITPLISLLNSYQQITIEAYGSNGEVSFYTDSIYISEAPKAGFSAADVCGLIPVTFADTSLLNPNFTTTWQWDFGDSSPISTDQNPIHLFATTGAFNVTLTVSYVGGCSNIFSDTVYVYPLPIADFSFPNNVCGTTPVLFSDLSQSSGGTVITSWTWDFGDGSLQVNDQNPLHSFATPGTYTVALLVETDAGCIDSISFNITTIPSPVADFTVSSTCVGDVASFTNLTTIQGGGSINYSWNFGDSFTSALISPSHQYPNIAANYLVTLIAVASNGCEDTIIQDIRIGNKPVPQFTWSPQVVCKFNQVTFTNTSFGIGGDTISAYHWDFGDLSTSTDENPFHAYSDTGFYAVTLTVTSPTACDSSVTQQVYVIPSPTASFTATNVCLGVPTNFNPLTTTPPGTQIDSIVWDFGDGATFNGLASPSHIYNLPGTYVVTMTVYNNLLCTGSYIDSTIVYPIPVAAFTASLACSGSLVNFDGTSSQVSGDSLSTWLWDFDGLGTSSGSLTQFTFQNSGNYDVTLFVSSIHGCQDPVTIPVEVIQSPLFDFLFNEPCFGLPSNFTYLPLQNPPPIATLTWDFGDATISSQLNPTHTYLTIDTFNVTLTVLQNSTGCSTSIEKPLIIKPYPVAGFSFINSCEDLPVQFNDTSSVSTGSILSWDWDFGALGSSSDSNPAIVSNSPGTFPVSLTVTSDEGCESSVSDSLVVYGNPLAAFTPDPVFGSPPLLVNFINSTVNGVSYEWNFGDGNSGSGLTVNHTYQDTGLYNISMIATSIEGCIDSVSHLVSVLIPFMDIAVNKIFITEDNDLLTVASEILNVGNVPVSSFQISANIQNGSVINEAWTGDFQPGESLIYTFNARYDITSKALPGYYCVKTDSPNSKVDQNPLNDSKCSVISSEFELFSISPNPFTDQFALNIGLPAQGDYEVTVFDMAGKLVYESGTVIGLKGFNKLEISTLNFSHGLYAIVVRYRDDVKTINGLNY